MKVTHVFCMRIFKFFTFSNLAEILSLSFLSSLSSRKHYLVHRWLTHSADSQFPLCLIDSSAHTSSIGSKIIVVIMAPLLIQFVDTETSCVESSISTQPIKVPLLVSSAAPKPSISFNPNVLVRLTIHIDEYSDEEITASWFCQDELKMIKSELRTTLLLMANGSTMANSERLCSRGLACFTSEGKESKKHRKEEARIAVFDEQDYQFDNDIFDPEEIANAYFEQTRKSQATATVVGFFDQQAVRQQSLPSLPIKISMKDGLSRSSSIGSSEGAIPLKFLSMAA
jgi:hypothetical protein